MASSTEAILSGERVVILLSRVPLEMVMMPSRLTTHALGMPSSGPNGTSTGISWMVRVTGATVIEARTA